jgi:hypothetical protein
MLVPSSPRARCVAIRHIPQQRSHLAPYVSAEWKEEEAKVQKRSARFRPSAKDLHAFSVV